MTSCPTPLRHSDTILMAHGGGGRMAAELLASVFLPAFANETLLELDDQAKVPFAAKGRLAITTDGFVVRPPFFPGGDIGRLAVSGTVNDLVAGGARPLHLTAAFILEEGLPIEELTRIVASMRVACDEAGVAIVAGDTKVVDRGKGDRIYITTTGVGVVPPGREVTSSNARDGDVVIVTGTLGDHGVAVMSVREGLELETSIVSDVAPLGSLVEALFAREIGVHAMRDPTRGGVGATLHEIAQRSGVGVVIDETALPVKEGVRGACEILGLDPIHVANEGKLVVIVKKEDAERAVEALRQKPLGRDATIIGRVTSDGPGVVRLRTGIGGERIVPYLTGEQLPRIC